MTDSLSWPDVLTTVLGGRDLSVSEATWAMRRVMEGEVADAELGGVLLALRAKGGVVEVIVGLRDASPEAAVPRAADPNVLDVGRTGGDRFGTVNFSSMASIVIAATGIHVVKHGNRAASSKSGSSDVLASLGIELGLAPDRVAAVLEEA